MGCLPDTPFPHLEESIVALHEAGFLVSVDSLEDELLLRGGRAAADYLLSLSDKTRWIADEVPSTPVLIPEPHGGPQSLYRVIDHFSAKTTGVFCRLYFGADPFWLHQVIATLSCLA